MTIAITVPAFAHAAIPARTGAVTPAAGPATAANGADVPNSGGFAATLASAPTAPARSTRPETVVVAPLLAAGAPGKILPTATVAVAVPCAPATNRPAAASRERAPRDAPPGITTPATAESPTTPPPPVVQVLAPAAPPAIVPVVPTEAQPVAPTPDSRTTPVRTGAPAKGPAVTDAAAAVATAAPIEARTAAIAMVAGFAAPPISAAPPPPPTGRPNTALTAHAAIVANPQSRTADLPTAAPGTPASRTAAPAHPASAPPAATASGQPDASDPVTAPAASSQGPTVPAAVVTTMAGVTLSTPQISSPTAPDTPTDFATLVDSIARARSDNGASAAAAVGVTLNHADFGRVTLQFSARDKGLAVTMRSADPGFAPAVAAAASTSSGADAGNHGARHPGQQAADAPAPGSPTTNTGTSTGSSAGGAGSQSGNAPRGDTPRQNTSRTTADKPSPAARSGSDGADTAGIFA